MRKGLLLLIMALPLLAFSGCVLDNGGSRGTRAGTTADMNTLQSDVKRLQIQVENLQAQMDRFERDQQDELDRMKSALAGSEQLKSSIMKDVAIKITELENRRIKVTNSLDDRIDKVLREIKSMMAGSSGGGSSSGGSSSGGGGTEKGFYHTVVSGENPWSIARKYKDEYGVTTQDILDANGLKSEDPIHPGDKLFIPVKK